VSDLAEKIADVLFEYKGRLGAPVAREHAAAVILTVVRGALLSDEAIEVAARQLYNNCRDLADPGPEWDALPMRDHPERGDFRENRSLYLADAEDVLRAALDAVTTREEA
jgi:hypothetical protein